MKNVNVKVEMNAAGVVNVVGLNKDGSVSAVNYNVVETIGFTEFVDARIAAALAKASEPKASEPKTSVNKKGYESISTAGHTFTNIKGFKHEGIFHAVKFDVAGKGECIVGFAKDRNQFIEHFNGVNKEVTRADVIKRMAKYQGKDAAQLTKMIQGLKPVTMAADVCSSCGCGVNRGVKEYSTRNFGKVLCRPCQDNNKPGKGAPSESEARKCKCGAELQGSWDDCSTCFSNSQVENHLDHEHVCACGNTKERAFEQCEECRDNKIVVLDNQMTFKDARLLAEQEALHEMLVEDALPEFNVGYDYDYSEVYPTEEDKEGKSKKGKTKRSKGKTAAQKKDAVDADSEERTPSAKSSSSSKGSEVSHDYSELFDASELTVNAGLKGMDGADAEPVE